MSLELSSFQIVLFLFCRYRFMLACVGLRSMYDALISELVFFVCFLNNKASCQEQKSAQQYPGVLNLFSYFSV